MEIRAENTLTKEEAADLKFVIDEFFKIDSEVVIDGTYIYYRWT